VVSDTPSIYHTSIRIGEEADAVRSQLAGACMTIKSLQTQLAAAQAENERLKSELHQTQKDRQAEHDLRCRLNGELEQWYKCELFHRDRDTAIDNAN